MRSSSTPPPCPFPCGDKPPRLEAACPRRGREPNLTRTCITFAISYLVYPRSVARRTVRLPAHDIAMLASHWKEALYDSIVGDFSQRYDVLLTASLRS